MDIGFIGLGRMGAGMAHNVLKAGHSLTVYARRGPEAVKSFLDKGASWADTPRAVAQASEIILSCVAGPKDVEAISLGKDGIIEGIRPNGVFIDLSTITPRMAVRIYEEFKKKGSHVMDAPISGGPPLAWSGELAIMAGGDEEVFDRCKPLLNCLGNKVGYTGPIGTGSICKNMQVAMLYTIQLVLAEGFTLGVKAGVKPKGLWRAFRDSVIGGELYRQTLPDTLFQNRFEPASMPVQLAMKDLDQAIALGREFEVPMAMVSRTLQELIVAKNKGWGDKDVRISMLLQEERAGNVEVRIPVAEMEEDGYKSPEKW
jgi:3-hydroxyisobutyrate dehydrogenase-like beta-hydroxyacid dehydrogenase